MKKRVGTRLYDTEKSDLIDTLPNGVKVYRKKNSPLFYFYDETAPNKHEMFRDLTPEQAEKYIPANTKSKTTTNSSNTIRFSPYNLERIRQHAVRLGIPASKFVMMLVDEYERTLK